jgi:predicted nicotinamide N-methyase
MVHGTSSTNRLSSIMIDELSPLQWSHTEESRPRIAERIQTIVRNVNGQEICIKLEAELSTNCYNVDQPATGHALWFAAENMCGLVEKLLADHNPDDPKTSLLELGAGPGLAGIYAAKLLAQSLQTVVLTDGDADVVDLMKRNIQRNHAGCSSGEVLMWGQATANQELLERHSLPSGFRIILGADLIYGRCSMSTIRLLFETVHQLLSIDGCFYLAFTRRNLPIDVVLAEANAQGLVWELLDDFVYDIFDNNVDGTTDFWRDAIYAFRIGDGVRQMQETALQGELEVHGISCDRN